LGAGKSEIVEVEVEVKVWLHLQTTV